MEKDECFNDFQIKLMDIVKQSHQLGDPYFDMKIKQKIMRSLSKRFESKVTAIKENNEYKKMKPSEVIGKLLAYEVMKLTFQRKRQKGIVLRIDSNEKRHSDFNEKVALTVRSFKKFLKLEKKGKAIAAIQVTVMTLKIMMTLLVMKRVWPNL